MTSENISTQPDDEYEKMSKDFLKHLYDDSFSEVMHRTNNIKNEHTLIKNKIDVLNSQLSDKIKFQENYNKCLEYYQKTVRLKNELLSLNENCIQMKKKALQLKEKSEQNKTRILIEQQKQIEEEKKLQPVFNPNQLKPSTAASAASSSSDNRKMSSAAGAQGSRILINSPIATRADSSSIDKTKQESTTVPVTQQNTVDNKIPTATVVNEKTMKLIKKPKHRAKAIEPDSVESSSTSTDTK